MVVTRSGRSASIGTQAKQPKSTNHRKAYVLSLMMAIAAATGGRSYWKHTAPERNFQNLQRRLYEARANEQFSCGMDSLSVACKSNSALLYDLSTTSEWVQDLVAGGMTKRQALQAVQHYRTNPSGNVSRSIMHLIVTGQQLREKAEKARAELLIAQRTLQRALARNKNSEGAVRRYKNTVKRQTIAPAPRRKK
jgi:hypothetical protein